MEYLKMDKVGVNEEAVINYLKNKIMKCNTLLEFDMEWTDMGKSIRINREEKWKTWTEKMDAYRWMWHIILDNQRRKEKIKRKQC